MIDTVVNAMKSAPFLTARWTNLILLTYTVAPGQLQPFVPPGCTLDLLEGNAFVSLVAFDFEETRVFGRRWPGFTRFPEINLRFYVRHRDATGEHRGVCFLREYVPLFIVARLANWIYNERYKVAGMKSEITHHPGTITVQHSLRTRGKLNSVKLVADANTVCPAPDSTECFFKEHEWGYGTSRRGGLVRYRVLHPVWNIHPVISFTLDWDWSGVYGPQWAALQDKPPMSVMLAQGSAVEVYPKGVSQTDRTSERSA
jgi:uncharacterized protein YqjF (DUF2071 family)